MANSPNTPAFESAFTPSLDVACDAGGGVLGHPRVYLHIDPKEGQITCPYCSKQFVYQPGESAAAA